MSKLGKKVSAEEKNLYLPTYFSMFYLKRSVLSEMSLFLVARGQQKQTGLFWAIKVHLKDFRSSREPKDFCHSIKMLYHLMQNKSKFYAEKCCLFPM